MAGVWWSPENVLLCPGLVLLKAFSQCRKECTLVGEGKDERWWDGGRRRKKKRRTRTRTRRTRDERRRTGKRSKKVEMIEQRI